MNLTNEEIQELESSDICVKCNHRQLFHPWYECDNSCILSGCECESFMRIGEYSNWSVDLPRYKYSDLFDTFPSYLVKRAIDSVIKMENKFNSDFKFPDTRKVIKIVKCSRKVNKSESDSTE